MDNNLSQFQIYDGSEFNRLKKGTIFVKLFREDDIHNELHYKDGLNSDTKPFNRYSVAGLHFVDIKHLYDAFLNLHKKGSYWGLNYKTLELDVYRASGYNYMRIVRIPDDAQVNMTKEGFRASKLFLEERYIILDHPLFTIPENCLKMVSIDGRLLLFVKNQTQGICSHAILQNPQALAYVKNQTDEICILALLKSNDKSIFDLIRFKPQAYYLSKSNILAKM